MDTVEFSYSYIYGDPDLGAIYVANSDSDGVSVINSVTNELVAAVIFNIKPFGTGDIVCDAIDAPINRFFLRVTWDKMHC
jgi:YVTN family beta-propeller protein